MTATLERAVVAPARIVTLVEPARVAAVRALVEAAGNFHPGECDIAAELVEERLARGAASGYEFLFLDTGLELAAYACFGPIPGTDRSFDLYWIVVAPRHQGRGFGRLLIEEVERRVAAAGGRRLFVETSSRDDYADARRFYERSGYVVTARLADFYADGDDEIIYVKRFPDDGPTDPAGAVPTRA